MNPLYATSLLPVIAVALLLFFTAALHGKNARGLALYCLAVAAWCTALFFLCVPRTAALGQRLAALGAFTAAGYLHAAYDVTGQRSYALVWFAWAAATAIAGFGFVWPALLHQPGGLGRGPLFWPAMALAVGAAVVPLVQVGAAVRRASAERRGPLQLLLLAGLLAYVGALGNALLLAWGHALPFGPLLVLGGLLLLAFVIRAHEPTADRRLLERSLRVAALGSILYGALFFAVLQLVPEPLAGPYRAGALGLFVTAALALEPVRQLVLESIGRRIAPDHVPPRALARAFAATEERADQAARLAELGGLVSAIAHEVRNPLGVLSAHLALLERRGADGEAIAAMREQIDRAGHFVGELLAYGRPRPLALRLVDLDATADLALSTARAGLGARAPEVTVEHPRSGALPVEADQGQLTQLFVILVENALLALEAAPVRRLRITVTAVGDRVRAAVEDSGPGVPAQLVPRLFQPFVTGRRREGPHGGTGLGLAIARGIAERHGGTLRVETSELGGARFVLELPRLQPVLAASAREAAPEAP